MNSGEFQVAVIGGGVVGCAVLRAFALAGVRALYIEVCFEEFYEGSPRFRDLHEILTAIGFKLRSFHEARLGTDDCLAYANALYLKPSKQPAP